MRNLTIERRFRGPPGSGNGGYVCGMLAGLLDGQGAEVTLRKPPPLDTAMTVERRADGSIALLHEGALVAEAKPGNPGIEAPPAPDFADAEAASRRFIGWQFHAFPGCFVCGPEREAGDGLRIFPGPTGMHMVAAPWSPDEGLAGPDGAVRPEFLWAALDCPGAFAAMGDRPGTFLLGRFTVELRGTVRPVERCTLAGWQIAADGRKRHVGTALYDAAGAVAGIGRAVWFDMGSGV